MRFESDKDAWELDDAEERQRNAPDLYSIPLLSDRSQLPLGERVGLFFLFRGRDAHGLFLQSERLTVTVTRVGEDGYEGILDESPASSEVVKKGDVISFEPRHVASMQHRSATE